MRRTTRKFGPDGFHVDQMVQARKLVGRSLVQRQKAQKDQDRLGWVSFPRPMPAKRSPFQDKACDAWRHLAPSLRTERRTSHIQPDWSQRPRHPASSGLISTTMTVTSWHLGHSKVRRSRLVSSGSIKTSHIGVSQELHHRWFCIRSRGRA